LDAGRQGKTAAITHLAWNCRGSGGSFRSSTMLHLARLLNSTKSQVCFISETRNASITKNAIKNHFNYKDAFVVTSQGQSGGLWLIWNDDIDLTVVDHSHHFIFALCTNKATMKQYGLVCIYGDPHHRLTSVIWSQVLNFIELNNSLPMFCMGDFIDIMHASEKLGPSAADVNRISNFCGYVKQCGLFDLGYSGPAYTWTNKHFSSIPTYERLDRCLGNAEWCLAHPNTTIYHLPMMYSDHAPILVVLNSQRPRINKPFRFENWWLMDEQYHVIAKDSWNLSSNRMFSQKTKFLVADLKKWRRKKPKNSDLLAQIENQILDEQSLHPTQQNHSLQEKFHQEHQNLIAKEEKYHIQRAKKNWAIKGDRNTAFFYKAIIKRNRKNKITYLINPDGSHSTTPQQLADTLVQYFTTIFTSQTNSTHAQTHSQTHHLTPTLPHPADQANEEEQAAQYGDIFRYTYSTPNM
jgi:hypothetical protein